VLALDAFRGLAVGLMLLVNNIALDTATPTQLTHAPWKGGIRLADLVFPWFLFVVGVAIPFSAASARRKGIPTWQYDLRVLKRAVLLVLLGCLLDSSVYKRPIFDLGVLQLIGLAYLVAALLYDLALTRRMLVAGLMLVGYWGAIKFLPVPGLGTGVFDEDRNLIAYINATHLQALSLVGLTSAIPTAALALIGTAVGDVLRGREHYTRQVARLLVAAAGLVVVGFLWSLSLQFSKLYWTPSFILVTAGTACAVLGLMYLVIDGAGWSWWAYPLIVFGANAIVGYVAPILVKTLIFQVWQINPGGAGLRSLQQYFLDFCVNRTDRVTGGWIYTLGYLFIAWLALWYLYRKGLFVRV
jgi:predicted acyltransferase